jgi:hypothetical protein
MDLINPLAYFEGFQMPPDWVMLPNSSPAKHHQMKVEIVLIYAATYTVTIYL